MPGVFISYRRSDTAPLAARLKKQLDIAFGDEYVFMDVDSLRPGEPFKQVIEETIESIEVVLALIGHDWVTVTDAAGGRRLENPGDFVRLELATGFQFDRVVIPVLLEKRLDAAGNRAARADRTSRPEARDRDSGHDLGQRRRAPRAAPGRGRRHDSAVSVPGHGGVRENRRSAILRAGRRRSGRSRTGSRRRRCSASSAHRGVASRR